MSEAEKTGPGKGTHWSNLISILGVGGKKTAEAPPPPTASIEPAPEPMAPAAAETNDTSTGSDGGSNDLLVGWGKPSAKKRPVETKAAPARKPMVPAPSSEKPAARPTPSPRKKHWGSLAEQLGLETQESESNVADEPTWIEESEQNGNTLSGDDAADECVSHPGGSVCAPEECEVRSEACQMRSPREDEVLDTRDTEFLDDRPASDEDLDALADLINEGGPPPIAARRAPRREEEDDDFDRPRDDAPDSPESRETRTEGEEGGNKRRRRRRGRGRGRRDEAGDERRPAREPSAREPASRESTSRESSRREAPPRDGDSEGRYGGFDNRVAKRRVSGDEDLDHDLVHDLDHDSDAHASEEDSDRDVRRPEREEESRDKEGRPRRRRRRRRGSEDATEGARSSRRDDEPTDRVRGSDPSYRRREESAEFDDEEEGDEPATSHRNLPTWEDALSAIVEGNIENRARSPQQHFGNRGRGSRDRGGDRDRGGERGGSDRGGDRGGGDRDRGGDRGGDRGSARGSDRGGDRVPERTSERSSERSSRDRDRGFERDRGGDRERGSSDRGSSDRGSDRGPERGPPRGRSDRR